MSARRPRPDSSSRTKRSAALPGLTTAIAYVGLLRADVREYALAERRSGQHPSGVGTDRHRGRAHRHRDAGPGRVGRRAHTRRARGEHEAVAGEDHGALHQVRAVEALRKGGVRRRIDVRPRARADLGGELVRARERVARVRVVCAERPL